MFVVLMALALATEGPPEPTLEEATPLSASEVFGMGGGPLPAEWFEPPPPSLRNYELPTTHPLTRDVHVGLAASTGVMVVSTGVMATSWDQRTINGGAAMLVVGYAGLTGSAMAQTLAYRRRGVATSSAPLWAGALVALPGLAMGPSGAPLLVYSVLSPLVQIALNSAALRRHRAPTRRHSRSQRRARRAL